MDLRRPHFAEIAPRLDGNRLAVYNALRQAGEATGSELARLMGWPVTSVRPRLTNLRDMEMAEPTGERRDNGTGSKEHVFRVMRQEWQEEMAI